MKLKLEMYEKFFEEIDAVDNGVSKYPKDIKPKYFSAGTNMCHRVSSLNQPWYDLVPKNDLELFRKAMEVCEDDFLRVLKNVYAKLFIAFKWVKDAILNRKKIDCSE